MEAVLELEKHNNDQLLELHSIAAECHDIHTTSFLEENYLKQQVYSFTSTVSFVQFHLHILLLNSMVELFTFNVFLQIS